MFYGFSCRVLFDGEHEEYELRKDSTVRDMKRLVAEKQPYGIQHHLDYQIEQLHLFRDGDEISDDNKSFTHYNGLVMKR